MNAMLTDVTLSGQTNVQTFRNTYGKWLAAQELIVLNTAAQDLKIKFNMGRAPIVRNPSFLRSIIGSVEPYMDQAAGYIAYRWKFPKPLFIAPGQSPDISYATAPVSPSQYIYTILNGTLLDKPPAGRVAIPFANAWQPATSVRDTGLAITTVSDVSALANPFAVPLFVTELNGYWQSAGQDFVLTSPFVATVQLLNAGSREAAKRGSNQTIFVRDYAPWHSIFPHGSRNWKINAAMAPRSFIQARVRTTTASGTDSSVACAPIIGMVGYRMGDISELGG